MRADGIGLLKIGRAQASARAWCSFGPAQIECPASLYNISPLGSEPALILPASSSLNRDWSTLGPSSRQFAHREWWELHKCRTCQCVVVCRFSPFLP